jgi:phage portal protein BeeE
MTAFELRETMMGHLLLRGNAFAEIVRDASGRVRQLWPLHPDKMTVQRDGYSPADRLRYTYELPNGEKVKLEGSSDPDVADSAAP